MGKLRIAALLIAAAHTAFQALERLPKQKLIFTSRKVYVRLLNLTSVPNRYFAFIESLTLSRYVLRLNRRRTTRCVLPARVVLPPFNYLEV